MIDHMIAYTLSGDDDGAVGGAAPLLGAVVWVPGDEATRSVRRPLGDVYGGLLRLRLDELSFKSNISRQSCRVFEKN